MADDWTTGEFEQENDDRFDDLDFGQGAADGKSVKDIEDDANLEVPIGEHTFLVKKIEVTTVDREGSPVLKFWESYLGAEKTGYHALGGRVVLALISDPQRTISLPFRTPPRDPGEVHVYVTATKTANGHKNGMGWWWKSLKHFLGHLGFPMLDNGQLPPAATTFGAWKRWPDGKPRTIVAKIVAGTPMENADPSKRVWNQIESFSFKDSADTLARKGASASNAGGASGPPPAGKPAPTTPKPPTSSPATAPAPPARSGEPVGTRVPRPASGQGGAAPVAATVPADDADDGNWAV